MQAKLKVLRLHHTGKWNRIRLCPRSPFLPRHFLFSTHLDFVPISRPLAFMEICPIRMLQPTSVPCKLLLITNLKLILIHVRIPECKIRARCRAFHFGGYVMGS